MIRGPTFVTPFILKLYTDEHVSVYFVVSIDKEIQFVMYEIVAFLYSKFFFSVTQLSPIRPENDLVPPLKMIPTPQLSKKLV